MKPFKLTKEKPMRSMKLLRHMQKKSRSVCVSLDLCFKQNQKTVKLADTVATKSEIVADAKLKKKTGCSCT
jgi:hypothetical protein